jgi:hypothetical protein
VVAIGERGLADSIRGHVTQFWIAVLTGRAFLMALPKGNRYEWAFMSPNINWTLPEDLEHKARHQIRSCAWLPDRGQTSYSASQIGSKCPILHHK